VKNSGFKICLKKLWKICVCCDLSSTFWL